MKFVLYCYLTGIYFSSAWEWGRVVQDKFSVQSDYIIILKSLIVPLFLQCTSYGHVICVKNIYMWPRENILSNWQRVNLNHKTIL